MGRLKARAALFREIGVALRIEEVDVDEPADNEVLLRTAACGVCHSDVHFMQGSIAGPVPTVPGHEPAGIVEAVGSAVRSVKPGDHVIACTSIYCGNCKPVPAGSAAPVHGSGCFAPQEGGPPSSQPKRRGDPAVRGPVGLR
jgi:S-(hydroxymethyl)glutathione dehydrogenase / alcohol dehydrogenase